MQIYTIYLATNIVNGKHYVGFDSCWPKRRESHKYAAQNPKRNTYRTAFHSAIRKYGFESFKWNVIYQSVDRDHTLNEMERHFITEYNTYCGANSSDGYNLTLGGEGTFGFKQSEETRKKISATGKGKLGRKPSEETRKKLSTASKGRRHSEETRNKMSLAKKAMSEETKNKMSLAKKGKLKKNSRQISTPHGIFDSIKMAATELNLYTSTVRHRLTSRSFRDWYYLL